MWHKARKPGAIAWQKGKLIRTPVEILPASASHFRRWLLVVLLIMFLLGSTTLIVWRTSSWLISSDILKIAPQRVAIGPVVSKGDRDAACFISSPASSL